MGSKIRLVRQKRSSDSRIVFRMTTQVGTVHLQSGGTFAFVVWWILCICNLIELVNSF